MQISNACIAEIVGKNGYDWIAVDLEHGSFSIESLPSIFRSLEVYNTIPIARLSSNKGLEATQVLDAGAYGIIVPMICNKIQIEKIISKSAYPPLGTRGVGFSRGNMYGDSLKENLHKPVRPIVIAQIENVSAIENIDEILAVKGLDGVFIGPYDLSASMGIPGQFTNKNFQEKLNKFIDSCKKFKIPFGIHVVKPDVEELQKRINQGYQIIAYSTDTYFLMSASKFPINY